MIQQIFLANENLQFLKDILKKPRSNFKIGKLNFLHISQSDQGRI